jgi:hypothetical protein
VLLTRLPLSPQTNPRFPFDLHVLGTPPAFILSQDQTLRKSHFLFGTQSSRAPSYHSSVVKVLLKGGAVYHAYPLLSNPRLAATNLALPILPT